MPSSSATLPGRRESHGPTRFPARSAVDRGTRFLVLLLLPLLCCRPAPPPPVRIGVITYQPSDLNGPSTSNAIQLAAEEANAAGGLLIGGVRRQVEIRSLVINEGSPEQAVAGVQKLINQEKVCAIIGPQNSDEAIPAAGLANRSGIPLVSPISSHVMTTKDRPFVFRTCFRDDVQGKAMARFAREALKAKTAALLVEVSHTYSRMIAEVFRREFIALGGRIVADTAFTDPKEDLGRQLQEIKRSGADVLVLPNYNEASRVAGIAARRLGIRSRFLGSDAWSRSHLRSVPEFDGSFMVTNWSPGLETEVNARFLAAYARRFPIEPSETAALTYDAAKLLFAAIATTGDGSPVSIQQALYGLRDFVGTSGRIRYTTNGDPEKAVVVLQFKAGKDHVAQVLAAGTGP